MDYFTWLNSYESKDFEMKVKSEKMKKILAIGLGMLVGMLVGAGIIASLLYANWWGFGEKKDMEVQAMAKFERVKKEYEKEIKKNDEELDNKWKKWTKEETEKKKGSKKDENFLKEVIYPKRCKLSYQTIKRYEKIVEKYPKSSVADDCLFEAIRILERLQLFIGGPPPIFFFPLFVDSKELAKKNREIDSKILKYVNHLINKYPESELAEFEKIKIELMKMKIKEEQLNRLKYEERSKIQTNEYYEKRREEKKNLIPKYEALTNKYPKSQIVDDCLFEIIILLALAGTGEDYTKAMEYADRLYKEYPESEFGDTAYLFIGMGWCGFLEYTNYDYVDAYIQLVKRYPKSKYALVVSSFFIEDRR
jgi:tetratricopeptide (TPR) repeat protein